MVAQMAHQRASINVGEYWNLETFQELVGDLLRTPVGTHARELAHDQAFNVRACGFVVIRVGAVIADFGIGENDNLPSVGRIGENFLIAGDGSIKYYFP